MRQKTLADEGFEKFRTQTRKEQFLGEMERIISLKEPTAAIEPFYPNPQGAHRHERFCVVIKVSISYFSKLSLITGLR